jgi:hypothetical protein
MDAFFVPTTRFRDRYYAHGGEGDLNGLVELELTEGCAGEVLLHRGFTWDNFYSFVNGKFVWIKEDVFIDLSLTGARLLQNDYEQFLSVSGGPEFDVYASSMASATSVCDILLQLLTTCESRTLMLTGDSESTIPVSGLAFSHFLIHSNHSLKVLRAESLVLDACHCHAIDASTRTDHLQIDLNVVQVTELGESVLVLESIRQNRGPTRLSFAPLDANYLADALRGNSRVSKRLLKMRPPQVEFRWSPYLGRKLGYPVAVSVAPSETGDP